LISLGIPEYLANKMDYIENPLDGTIIISDSSGNAKNSGVNINNVPKINDLGSNGDVVETFSCNKILQLITARQIQIIASSTAPDSSIYNFWLDTSNSHFICIFIVNLYKYFINKYCLLYDI
jgi:hypothetical protein